MKENVVPNPEAGSQETSVALGADAAGNSCHVEKQSLDEKRNHASSEHLAVPEETPLTILVSHHPESLHQHGDRIANPAPETELNQNAYLGKDSPKKPDLSRDPSSHEQCRVCQQEKDDTLIDLGCHCRGGLAKAHESCINTWFSSRGSNRCEICQQVAGNVAVPESQPSASYWVWRVGPAHRGRSIGQGRERGCFGPLWVAFSILIGGLLLDVLISITLGVSALPVNIIIGVIVVLGLGTALRLAFEFCNEWSLRRVVHRVEANASMGYHPAL
ncbi:unnamed protein product [Coffea canephora]|uniref:RING-CH-type domain-containing protein n=1 Tax=Coffea canephora TaxID=49390 RepID=A0A068UXC0_COFCA|nr:unnamed protein product [Coffea canephora]